MTPNNMSEGTAPAMDAQPEFDTSYLPETFDTDDFDLVSKELWLQGFWLDRKNPGYVDIYVEQAAKHNRKSPLAVGCYAKKWMAKEWELTVYETPGYYEVPR